VEKPGLAAAQPGKKLAAQELPRQATGAARPAIKKSVDKATVVTAKALTKPVRIAKADPLAPLEAKHSGNSKGSTADR
jgi:hypothetical protein